MANVRNIISWSMLAVGGAIVVYALFHAKPGTNIEGWEPVNETLSQSLATIAAPQNTFEVEKAASSSLTPQSTLANAPKETTIASSPDNAIQEPAPLPPNDAPQVATETQSARTDTLLDLNAATQAQLESLPGIGPAKAIAIVTFREKIGGFTRMKQLLEVKGIGDKLIEKITVHAFITEK